MDTHPAITLSEVVVFAAAFLIQDRCIQKRSVSSHAKKYPAALARIYAE